MSLPEDDYVPPPVQPHEPQLLKMLLGAMPQERLDPTGASMLADWLEERGDPRAADVRALAEAKWFAPSRVPGYYRPAGGAPWPPHVDDSLGVLGIEDCPPTAPYARARTWPVCCGPWWAIELCPYPDRAVAQGTLAVAFDLDGYDAASAAAEQVQRAYVHAGLVHDLPPLPEGELPSRQALAAVLAEAVPGLLASMTAALFGHDPTALVACGACGRCRSCRRGTDGTYRTAHAGHYA